MLRKIPPEGLSRNRLDRYDAHEEAAEALHGKDGSVAAGNAAALA